MSQARVLDIRSLRSEGEVGESPSPSRNEEMQQDNRLGQQANMLVDKKVAVCEGPKVTRSEDSLVSPCSKTLLSSKTKDQKQKKCSAGDDDRVENGNPITTNVKEKGVQQKIKEDQAISALQGQLEKEIKDFSNASEDGKHFLHSMDQLICSLRSWQKEREENLHVIKIEQSQAEVKTARARVESSDVSSSPTCSLDETLTFSQQWAEKVIGSSERWLQEDSIFKTGFGAQYDADAGITEMALASQPDRAQSSTELRREIAEMLAQQDLAAGQANGFAQHQGEGEESLQADQYAPAENDGAGALADQLEGYTNELDALLLKL